MGIIAARVAVIAAAGGAISWIGDFPFFLLVSSFVFIIAVAFVTFGRDPLRAELAEAGVTNFVVSRGDNRHFAGIGSEPGLYMGNRVRRAWVYARDIESMTVDAGQNQVSLDINTSVAGFPLLQIHFLPDASSVRQGSAAYRKAFAQAEEWLQLLNGKVAKIADFAAFKPQEA